MAPDRASMAHRAGATIRTRGTTDPPTTRKNTSMTPSLPLACVCFAIAALAFPAGLHALWVGWREERRVRERLYR